MKDDIHKKIALAVGGLNCAAFAFWAPYREEFLKYSDLPAVITAIGVFFLAYAWVISGFYVILPARIFKDRKSEDAISEVFGWFPVRKAAVPLWVMAIAGFLFLSFFNGVLLYDGFVNY